MNFIEHIVAGLARELLRDQKPRTWRLTYAAQRVVYDHEDEIWIEGGLSTEDIVWLKVGRVLTGL